MLYLRWRSPLGIFLGLSVLILAARTIYAAESPVSSFDMEDYETVVSSYPWAQAPSPHHRLYLDIYNVTDFFDAETANTAAFADHTVLADTIRPTATILWDDRFRIELGAIAEKSYGSQPGFLSVDPWVQLLWQPIKPLSVIMGNLDTPHYYYPAIFYPNNYFELNVNSARLPPIPQLQSLPAGYFTQSPTETGAQLILDKPAIHDDLFFNYQLQDVPEHNEKFSLGFVHRNVLWEHIVFHYQTHWIHYGGQFFPHTIFTRNDVAQAVGGGFQFHPFRQIMFGGTYSRLYSHLRQEADPTNSIPRTAGKGNLFQAWARYGRLKLIFGDWRGHQYYHETGDPMFILPNVDLGTIRWDIILGRDFNLYAETTGYFIGNNNLGYDHYVKTAFHIQASYQFSIPLMEWTTPSVAPEGSPIPSRWDYGL